jgi:hypothetical protein
MPRDSDPIRRGSTTLVFMVVDENQSQHRAALTIIYEKTVLSRAVGMEKGTREPHSVTHSDIRNLECRSEIPATGPGADFPSAPHSGWIRVARMLARKDQVFLVRPLNLDMIV